MFKSKGLKQQFIIITIIMFMLMGFGVVASRLYDWNADINTWQIFEFENLYFDANVAFVVEQQENQIVSTLTNESESEIITGMGFTLVKQTGFENNEWRVVPFRKDLAFPEKAIILPPGYSVIFTLTQDMLATNILPGHYRFVTEIWANEKSTQVWASFDLIERN